MQECLSPIIHTAKGLSAPTGACEFSACFRECIFKGQLPSTKALMNALKEGSQKQPESSLRKSLLDTSQTL